MTTATLSGSRAQRFEGSTNKWLAPSNFTGSQWLPNDLQVVMNTGVALLSLLAWSGGNKIVKKRSAIV